MNECPGAKTQGNAFTVNTVRIRSFASEPAKDELPTAFFLLFSDFSGTKPQQS